MSALASGDGEIVLISNGPGELYTWVRPVLREFRRRAPGLRVVICLIPCQFASGNEAAIAADFGADAVTTPAQYLAYMATGRRPAGMGAAHGAVVSLGGNAGMAVRLGEKLGYPTYRYSFAPAWQQGLERLFVHDATAVRRARRGGAPRDRVEPVGNLVADAVEASEPAEVAGRPHLLLFPSSRDLHALHLIPFFIALADTLGARYPEASFAWPVSRLLRPETIEAGIAGRKRATLNGVAGERRGDAVVTPRGSVIAMVAESERYRHMRAADLAVTIPGTNTLELGIAGVPSVVLLPLNRPEIIPLEGVGHWLGLIPLVGRTLKRQAVRLFVEGLDVPVSLPNRFSGEPLFVELKGTLSVDGVAERTAALLDDEAGRAERRRRLHDTMPRSGAAARLVTSVLADLATLRPQATTALTTAGEMGTP